MGEVVVGDGCALDVRDTVKRAQAMKFDTNRKTDSSTQANRCWIAIGFGICIGICVSDAIGIGVDTGSISQHLALSGIIWWHPEASGKIGQQLKASGSIWQTLGSSGASGMIWQRLGAPGSI